VPVSASTLNEKKGERFTDVIDKASVANPNNPIFAVEVDVVKGDSAVKIKFELATLRPVEIGGVFGKQAAT